MLFQTSTNVQFKSLFTNNFDICQAVLCLIMRDNVNIVLFSQIFSINLLM